MTDNTKDTEGVALSLPIPILAVGILLGLAAATYVLLSRSNDEESSATASTARSGKRFGRRLGIMTMITLIENDTTRKVVVAALKAMARRA